MSGEVAVHPSVKHRPPALILSCTVVLWQGRRVFFTECFTVLIETEEKSFVFGHSPDLHVGRDKSVSHTFINKVLLRLILLTKFVKAITCTLQNVLISECTYSVSSTCSYCTKESRENLQEM